MRAADGHDDIRAGKITYRCAYAGNYQPHPAKKHRHGHSLPFATEIGAEYPGYRGYKYNHSDNKQHRVALVPADQFIHSSFGHVLFLL